MKLNENDEHRDAYEVARKAAITIDKKYGRGDVYERSEFIDVVATIIWLELRAEE